jgi:hypothetical protein
MAMSEHEVLQHAYHDDGPELTLELMRRLCDELRVNWRSPKLTPVQTVARNDVDNVRESGAELDGCGEIERTAQASAQRARAG